MVVIAENRTRGLAAPIALRQAAGRSLWRDALGRFLRNRASMTSLLILGLILLFCLIGPLIAKWANAKIDWGVLGSVSSKGAPSLANGHYFGTDELGHDLYSRTIQGIETSLTVGIVSAGIAVLIGTFYGAVAGFLGGRVDGLMMRLVDILHSIPYLFILILLLMVFGRSFVLLFVGIGLISWTGTARIVRGQTLALRNREFVEAAVASGVKPFSIITRHILPNLIGVVIVYATLLIPDMILLESFISFLGLGIQEPDTSLGTLISEGAATMQRGELWQIAFPLGFFVTILFCFFFLGDGLRDAFDPKDR